MAPTGGRTLRGCLTPERERFVFLAPSKLNLGLLNLSHTDVIGFHRRIKTTGLSLANLRSTFFPPIKAIEERKTAYVNGDASNAAGWNGSGLDSPADFTDDCAGASGESHETIYNVGSSTNIVWYECSIGRLERQKLLQQKGCVIWITGLSGSGKSSVACALSRGLHNRGKLSYVLDGDNVRHGLNSDLSFTAEDRAENIRRIGEVAKLFADAGVICITSLISPYRRERDACRAMMTEGNFIEVFLDVPLHVCEARDPKGLYKLARSGKIRGFTGVDDPYEPPLDYNTEAKERLFVSM
ncbi:PREDICTED: adenylyl-sulfate kinase 3-like isoform X2 [Nelumbo nucifera]|uniref:Adenylyl-sulfate kinase n=2 Tax=Nelumbo nucifera TaxID=4432 RepID=A0A1U8B985_NELNU|nr:PREDICTED: adenylyl-sulfate kinase 3-like isoform X2 [Nelumbo nucifera]DAD41504.1 TPA_asm: hypothetical protein HUJ06_015827 [Nelumbo nucifera]